jgi:hypothetical protein
MRAMPICLACAALVVLACRAPADVDGKALEEARAAYRASNFADAVSASEGRKELEFKLISCLALYENYKLYHQADDRKRAQVLRDILRVDVGLANVETLKSYFNVPGHLEGNKVALDLFEVALKRVGSEAHCRTVAGLIGDGMGEDAACVGFRALERHLKNVRAYVDSGGTMPEKERDLFTDKEFISVLSDGLKSRKTKSAAQSGLIAIEEPALSHLDAAEANEAVLDTILKIKRARERRLKKYPTSTWDSAFGRESLPPPTSTE